MYVSASDAKTTIIEMSASMCGSRFLVTKCYTLITIGFRQTFPKIDLYPTIITVSMKIVVMSGSFYAHVISFNAVGQKFLHHVTGILE